MFIRISDSGGRKYLRLVQAYRDEHGRTGQRQVAQLGRLDLLDEREVNELIDSLRRFIGWNGSLPAPRQMELEGEPVFERALEVGTTWLLTELWESLGFADLLRQALRASRCTFDVEAAVRLMIFNRLCDPESKPDVLRWLEGVVIRASMPMRSQPAPAARDGRAHGEAPCHNGKAIRAVVAASRYRAVSGVLRSDHDSHPR